MNQRSWPKGSYHTLEDFVIADNLLRPDDEPEVTFSNTSRRGGAVLSLPVDASLQDTLARRDFGQWMIKHIDYWLAFTRQLGLGIEQMEDIILVTGCHRTISWANVAFLEGHTNAQASFGVEVVRGLAVSVKWQFFPARVRGAMCSWGPEGKVRQIQGITAGAKMT